MVVITSPHAVSAYEQLVDTGNVAALQLAVRAKIGATAWDRSNVKVTIVKEEDYYQGTEAYCLTCRKASHRAPTLRAAADWIVALVTLEA